MTDTPGNTLIASPPDTAATEFRAGMAPGEISLEFGRIAGRAADSITVHLSNRIVMQPATLQHLIYALRDALHSPVLPPATYPAAVERIPVNAEPDQAATRAAGLFRLVAELGVPYRHERSFRISTTGLAANRFLLTVDKSALGAEAAARLANLGARLGLPTPFLEQIPAGLAAARCVHFGFEEDRGRILYKLYFELVAAQNQPADDLQPGTGVPLHFAWKWEAGTQSHPVLTHYTWYPRLDAGMIEARLASIYGKQVESFELARAALQFAGAQTSLEHLQYLEVTEDDNPRASFDLNLSDTGLRLLDLQPLLARLRERYGIRPGQFQALYDQIKSRPVGHIAGGMHRDGRDFFTVYYGVEDAAP